MSELTYVQYGGGGKKNESDVQMYWAPNAEDRKVLQRNPAAAVIRENLKRFQTRVGPRVEFQSEIGKDDAPFLEILGTYMVGRVPRLVLSTRPQLWQALMKQEKLRPTSDFLLREGSVTNEYLVCSGTDQGLLGRLERIKNVKDFNLTINFGVEFRSFVEERWPWKCVDVAWFSRLDRAEHLFDALTITGTSDAGPGYNRPVGQSMKPMRKGDNDAREMCATIVDTIIEELEKGHSFQEVFETFPGWFVAQMKPKCDYYLCEQVFSHDIYGRDSKVPLKTRPYFALQYHNSLLFSAIMQFVKDCAVNYQTDPKSWSMIGHSWMHGGTDKLYRYLLGEEEYVPPEVFTCLFYGDDAIYRWAFKGPDGDWYTFIACPDISGMDFTLLLSATGPHGGFSAFCDYKFKKWTSDSGIDAQSFLYPDKWRSIVAGFGILAVLMPFLYSGKDVIQCLAGLRSGFPGTTEFDTYQSFRIVFVLKQWMAKDLNKLAGLFERGQLSEDELQTQLQKVFSDAVSKMKRKFGVEFKKDTTTVYHPLSMSTPEDFGGLKVTDYTILGHRLTKVGAHWVPVKPLDEIWRSLVKPRKYYKNGTIADMAELERLRGVSINGGWLYKSTFAFLTEFFAERRSTGKINVSPKSLGKTFTVPLYPLSSIPTEILEKIKEADPDFYSELFLEVVEEEQLYKGLFHSDSLSSQILGNPDWFPDVEFISEIYSLERDQVDKATKFSLKDLKVQKKSDRGKNIKLAFSGLTWGGEMDEEDEEATEEIQDTLAEAGVPESSLRKLRVEGSGTSRPALLRTGREKPPPTTLQSKRGGRELAAGKTSKNEKRTRELRAERKAEGKKPYAGEDLEEKKDSSSIRARVLAKAAKPRAVTVPEGEEKGKRNTPRSTSSRMRSRSSTDEEQSNRDESDAQESGEEEDYPSSYM